MVQKLSMTTRINSVTFAACALATFTVACAIEPDDDPTHEIVENLRRAGFSDSAIEVHNDGVVFVGGDAVVSLQASREMVTGLEETDPAQKGEDRLKHYRTNNLVAPSVDNICIDGSAFTGIFSEALDNAIDNYNNENLTFEMRRVGGPLANCDAMITANVVPGDLSWSGFPSGGLPFDTINIAADVAGFGVPVTTQLIMHELGHCIGFRHTDYFNNAISCGTFEPESSDAIHIDNTPIDASWNGSVMNACTNLGSTGEWTNTDIAALGELYGLPAGARKLYRMFHWGIGDHFYTSSASERDFAVDVFGYQNEGIAGHVFASAAPGRAPLYRLWSSTQKDHFYTTSAAQRDFAIAIGYVNESSPGYVLSSPAANAAPLYRLYHSGGSNHFYTTSAAERDFAIAFGYTSEGNEGYLSTF